MAVQKPTKQQIAQAKARAGGNTTSKTTPARMAKGAKDIALFAAGIVGPGKAVKAVGKAAKVIKAESKAVGYKPSVLRHDPAKKNLIEKTALGRRAQDVTGSVQKRVASNPDSRMVKNRDASSTAEMRKSGFYAKSTAKAEERWNKMNPGGKKSIVKINSNPYKGK